MCLAPIPISYVDFLGRSVTMDAPCGKCIECVIALQNMWKIRLIEESKKYANAYFFTLTYRDSKLPYTYDKDTGEFYSSACKKDVQNWLKRFRTTYIRRKARDLGLKVSDITSGLCKRFKPKFSYFICAEYGPNGTHRPHYHGIIFTDLRYKDVCPLIADWRAHCGFVKFNRIRNRTDSSSSVSAPANYVAKYCCKGEFSSRSDDISSGRIEKAWRIMSKGIGDNYVSAQYHHHRPRRRGYSAKEYIETCVDRCFYADGDYKYKLPRYYKERIFYVKINYVQRYYDKKTNKCQARIASRYAARSKISLDMQACIRNRIDADYQRRFAEVRATNKTLSDTEIHLYLERLRQDSLESRKAVALGKLNNFYLENQLKFKYL